MGHTLLCLDDIRVSVPSRPKNLETNAVDCRGRLPSRLAQSISLNFSVHVDFLARLAFKLMGSFCLVRLSTEKNFAPFCSVLRINSRCIGGCLSYYAGYKLNAVAYGYSVLITASIVFLEWAIITLFIIKVLRHDEKSKLCHSEYVS